MTIHHDKMAYGKLISQREDLSEERLLEMLGMLSEEYDDEEDGAEKPSDTEGAERSV